MAIHTIGTNGTASLLALPAWSAVQLAADVAAISSSIVSDDAFVSNAKTGNVGPKAVLATGNTHGTVTLDTLVAAGGSPPLTQIQPGDEVLGPDIPATAYVTGVSGAVVTLSAAATATTVGGHYAFVRRPYIKNMLTLYGNTLRIPGRGQLIVKPGDYVVLDPATGWPILLSANEVSYAGSLWTFT